MPSPICGMVAQPGDWAIPTCINWPLMYTINCIKAETGCNYTCRSSKIEINASGRDTDGLTSGKADQRINMCTIQLNIRS